MRRPTRRTATVREPEQLTGTDRSTRGVDWRVRFALLSLVWGFSFLLIKVGTEGYAPLNVSLGRTVFGAAVLVVALALRRDGLPRSPRIWGHLVVSAVLLNALPYTLYAYAEQSIPSSLAGIINATAPLFGMVLSLVALSEDRPSRCRVVGLLIGFLGVLVVLGAWRGLDIRDPAATAMALGAPCSYAVGWLYVRRTLADAPYSHLSIASGQLLLATLELAIVTPLVTSLPSAFPTMPTLSVITLGVFGTGWAVLLQHRLVAEVGPTIGQMITYFIPILATAAGVFILGEQLTWNTFVGGGIVLVGAFLTQERLGRQPRQTHRRPGDSRAGDRSG